MVTDLLSISCTRKIQLRSYQVPLLISFEYHYLSLSIDIIEWILVWYVTRRNHKMSNYQTNNFHCHFAKSPCLQIFNSMRCKILDLTHEKKQWLESVPLIAIMWLAIYISFQLMLMLRETTDQRVRLPCSFHCHMT